MAKIDDAEDDEAERLSNKVVEIDFKRVWWQVLIALCYTAGTRLNEAIHLSWADIDFASDTVRIIAKRDTGDLQDWQPKGRDSRTVPIPTLTVNLLTHIQSVADEGSPYVLIPKYRLDAINAAKASGKWKEGAHAMNNIRRRWLELRRAAGIAHATIHDLRRSAITNWSRRLPIHVTQELGGHASIMTTRRYYLAVTETDMEAARNAAADAIKTVTTTASKAD